MGLSLGMTVGELLLAYLLHRVTPQEGKTPDAVLFGEMTARWPKPLNVLRFVLSCGHSRNVRRLLRLNATNTRAVSCNGFTLPAIVPEEAESHFTISCSSNKNRPGLA